MKSGVAYRGILIVVLPLFFELLLVFVLSVLLADSENELARQRKSREILDHSVLLSYKITETATLSALCQNLALPSLARRRDEAIVAVKRELATLRGLEGQNTEQLARLKAIYNACKTCFSGLDFIQLKEKQSDDLSVLLNNPGKFERAEKLVSEMGTTLNAFLKVERSTQEQNPGTQNTLKFKIILLLAGGAMANIAMAFGLAVYAGRGISKPLKILSENTLRVEKGQDLHAPLKSSNELGYIDKAFREMYSELNEADSKRRQLSKLTAQRLQAPLERARDGVKGLIAGEFGAFSESALARLQMAETGLKRITALLFDLSNAEQMDKGSLILHLQNVRIKQCVSNCLLYLQGYFSQKKIQIDVDVSDSCAFIDPDRIEQVLINLLSNAVKFSPIGAKIRILELHKDGFIEISVVDEGPGIAPEKLASIFDAFKQVSIDDANVRGGFGLGLAICKSIIEQHGGTIGVESRGSGSRFWFTVPAVDEASE